MKIRIDIDESWGTASEIKTLLEGCEVIQNAGIVVSKLEKRALETAILVATISATGVALGALIKGFLAIARGLNQRKITIKGRLGGSIEIPADTSSEKIDELIEKVRALDSPYISLS